MTTAKNYSLNYILFYAQPNGKRTGADDPMTECVIVLSVDTQAVSLNDPAGKLEVHFSVYWFPIVPTCGKMRLQLDSIRSCIDAPKLSTATPLNAPAHCEEYMPAQRNGTKR
jgi:hypothetical protein